MERFPNGECMICRAPLTYLVQAEEMSCVICRKKEMSKTRCINGHYVCSDCHTAGMDSIFTLCLQEKSTDPIEILRKMMATSLIEEKVLDLKNRIEKRMLPLE